MTTVPTAASLALAAQPIEAEIDAEIDAEIGAINVPAASVLHLVPNHEYEWRLRGIQYEDHLALNRFECACGDVRFTYLGSKLLR